jgi:hypothetical protein
VKPNISLVEVHPQLDNNEHLVDGALVGWFTMVQNSYSNFKSMAPNVKTGFSFLSNKVFQSKDVFDITNANSRTIVGKSLYKYCCIIVHVSSLRSKSLSSWSTESWVSIYCVRFDENKALVASWWGKAFAKVGWLRWFSMGVWLG